ncbi:ATP-dependent helicase [Nonomuraea sp. NPDC059007]|uniref:ATP-dependent helicase n=1 Tax=Nonomuraea sp. NPDC059007 TaxID=3346692 RepID=UPI00367CF65D
MTTPSSHLAHELVALNDEQKEAVAHPGNLAVLAGPGSGKTRTLVTKIAWLLERGEVSSWQSIAAITYTRPAAREIAMRLRQLGITPERQLVCSTLHSWCLGNILGPYGLLVGIPAPSAGSIIDEGSNPWKAVLESCKSDLGLHPNSSELTRARRVAAAGEHDEDVAHLFEFARLFDERLLASGLWDFDLITAVSLRILREHPNISKMIGSRFPWLVIDEYQDLGPVLHALVEHLHDKEQVKIAAFGDPDQTVMAFAGAHPRYLWSLAVRDDFHHVTLEINYRCGQAIIAASHLALNESRPHRADVRRQDAGFVEPLAVAGGLEDHAYLVTRKIHDLAAAGSALHSIAVLYPNSFVRAPLRDALVAAGIPHVLESDERLPKGELADFIRDCAARTVLGPQPSDARLHHINQVCTASELAYSYNKLRRSSDLPEFPMKVVRGQLTDALKTRDPDDLLGPWLTALVEALDLHTIAAASPIRDERKAIREFSGAAVAHALRLGDAAGTVRVGRVTVTTYHSAKGREWDFVLLPGLVEGVMPYRVWSGERRTHLEPTPNQLAEARRAFYVALTRAKVTALLFYGEYWETSWGARNAYGVSSIVGDMLRRLEAKEIRETSRPA